MIIISLYNLANIILFPFYVIMLLWRIIRGKENFKSLKSRFSFYSSKKTIAKKLIWVHAASVGESMIAMNLVDKLKKKYQSIDFLVTTGTLSSATIINKWLPPGVYHEFTPLDNFFVVMRFYRYWQPQLGIFIESDIWPALISSPARECKLILLNARLSDKSFRNWKKIPKIFNSLINYFSYVAVQSKIDLEKYQFLGCSNIENLGNLKFANKALQVDKKELNYLKKLFAGKRIFVASSTHKEDESILLNIIYQFKERKLANFYPVIILRHPERAAQVGLACSKLGLKHSIRSTKLGHNILEDDVYIVDSFGELGLFYSLSDVTFIGGSFKIKSHIAGHNLLEPAYFDNVIILGPNMSNFQNVTDEMIANKACIQISNAEALKEQILFFFDDRNLEAKQEYAKNAKKYVKSREKILANYLKQIDIYFND